MVNKNTYQQVVNRLQTTYHYGYQYIITAQLTIYFIPIILILQRVLLKDQILVNR